MNSFYDGKKILVSGGSGFIGSRLVEVLISLNAEVHLLEDTENNTWRLNNLRENFYLYQVESWRYPDILKVFEKINPDIVFNLRGKLKRIKTNDRQLQKFNIEESQNFLKAAESIGVDACVHIGTIAEYGNSISALSETTPEKPICEYGKSKLKTSLWLKDLIFSKNFSATIIRLSVVYGPKQNIHDYLIPNVIKNCISGEDFEIPSTGEQKRDPIYIDDAIDAILVAGLEKKALGEVINIGLGKDYSVGEISNTINKESDYPINITFSDDSHNDSIILDRWHDISKAMKILSWQPKYTLDEGIAKTLIWYNDNLKISRKN